MGPAPRRRVGLVPSAYHEHPDIGAFDLAVLCVLATHANRTGRMLAVSGDHRGRRQA